MFHRLCFSVFLAVLPAGAQLVIPDTPAAHTLREWLEAFNSGERGRIDAYRRKYQPDLSADSQMSFREMTGGFELLRVEGRQRLHIEFVVN